MKKLIPTVLILFTKIMVSQVGEVEVWERPILVGSANEISELLPPRLEYYHTDYGRYYVLTYLNGNQTSVDNIRGIGFKVTDKEIQYVYDFFKSGFENDDIRSLELGEDKLRIRQTDLKNTIYITVDHQDGGNGYFHLTPEQLDRLFGKSN